ncbi:MAG: hypothetical protein DBX59_11035 [Bacillota bacterium]|nr:MAG: hypothetical protein DBX59_11035 [Bacillota bacterium]
MKLSKFQRIKNKIFEPRGLLEKRSGGGKIVFAVFFVLFALYALSLLYPLFWMLINSFRDSTDYVIAMATGNAFSLKIVWNPQNYADVMSLITAADASYAAMAWNSVWITTLSSLLAVIVPTVTAYGLAKYTFRLRGTLYAIAIVTMILPIVGNGGATLKFWAGVGAYNTPFYIFFNGLGGLGGMYFLVMYGFFKSVHWSYAEAVFIDGGNDFTALFRVMLPQALNMMTLFFIMNFMAGWNEYQNLLIYMPSYPTLATGMYLVSNTLERTGKMPLYYAALTISIIPILVLFIAFSNQILTKVTISGIKG